MTQGLRVVMNRWVASGISLAMTGIGAFVLLYVVLTMAEMQHDVDEAIIMDENPDAAREAFQEVDDDAGSAFFVGLIGVLLMAGSHVPMAFAKQQ